MVYLKKGEIDNLFWRSREISNADISIMQNKIYAVRTKLHFLGEIEIY